MNNNNNNSFLIIGYGATAIVSGYILNNIGNFKVNYLIRNKNKINNTLKLYDINNNNVINFNTKFNENDDSNDNNNNIYIYDNLNDLKNNNDYYNIIIFTLSLTDLISESGKKLINNITKLYPKSYYTCFQPGIDTSNIYINESFNKILNKKQIIIGAFYFLSYKLPLENDKYYEIHKKKNKDYINCDFAFKMLKDNNHPFLSGDQFNNGNKYLKNILKKSKLNYAQNIPLSIFENVANIIFPLFIASELQGFKEGTPYLFSNELALASAAIRDIVSYHNYYFSFIFQSFVVKLFFKWQQYLSNDVDYESFNKAHHSQKVGTQNIYVLNDYVKKGEAKGLNMNNLKLLLSKL